MITYRHAKENPDFHSTMHSTMKVPDSPLHVCTSKVFGIHLNFFSIPQFSLNGKLKFLATKSCVSLNFGRGT